MKKLPTGDWELILEVPKGRHEFKFVLDGDNWICSNDMEITQDTNGNRNNVLSSSLCDKTIAPPCVGSLLRIARHAILLRFV